MIAEAKTRYALPIRTLAAQMRLSVASLSRWRRRLRRGEVAVGKRGPMKVKPLNLSELTARIRGLEHGKKRSQGSGLLHRTYGGGISRRELNARVRQVRYETNRVRCVETHHVTWLRANLVWAMDDWPKNQTSGRRQPSPSQPDRSAFPLPTAAPGLTRPSLRGGGGRASAVSL